MKAQPRTLSLAQRRSSPRRHVCVGNIAQKINDRSFAWTASTFICGVRDSTDLFNDSSHHAIAVLQLTHRTGQRLQSCHGGQKLSQDVNGFAWLGLLNNTSPGNNLDVETDTIDEHFGRRGGTITRGSMAFGTRVSYKHIHVAFPSYKLWMRETFIKNHVPTGHCRSGQCFHRWTDLVRESGATVKQFTTKKRTSTNMRRIACPRLSA